MQKGITIVENFGPKSLKFSKLVTFSFRKKATESPMVSKSQPLLPIAYRLAKLIVNWFIMNTGTPKLMSENWDL